VSKLNLALPAHLAGVRADIHRPVGNPLDPGQDFVSDDGRHASPAVGIMPAKELGMGRFTPQLQAILQKKLEKGLPREQAFRRVRKKNHRSTAERYEDIDSIQGRLDGAPPAEWSSVIGKVQEAIDLERELLRDPDELESSSWATARKPSRPDSNRDPLHDVPRHLLPPPVVEARGPRLRVPGGDGGEERGPH
jgi:hypothetical protein